MEDRIAQSAGVDISKDTLDVHLHPAGTARRFANATEGFSALIAWLGGFTIERVVFEPTGPYHHMFERRPASARAAEESLRNYRRIVGPAHEPAIEVAGPEGDAARNGLGRLLVEENEKAWHPIGVHLGYVYDPSPIVVPDGTPRPPDDTVGYVPNARPGARAARVVA